MANLIHKIKFDFTDHDLAQAKTLHDKVFGICRHNLSKALSDLFEKREGRFDQIEIIEIDIGKIEYSSLDSQLIPKTVAALENRLDDLLNPKGRKKPVIGLELLTNFLQNGVLHWSLSKNWNLNESAAEVIKNQWQGFLSFLRKTKELPIVAHRLAYELSDENYNNLIVRIQPIEARFVLDFVHDVVEVSLSRDTEYWGNTDLNRELKKLVLIDLVTTYGSLFNRKMFIQRQLIGLASRFRMGYLTLVQLLDTALRQEAEAFHLKSTLPFLIREIIKETDLETPTAEHISDATQLRRYLLVPDATAKEKQELLIRWPQLIREVPKEIYYLLKQEVNSSQMIARVVERLGNEQMDSLIELVEASNFKFIKTYKEAVLHSQVSKQTKRQVSILEKEINAFILGFLLLETGTRFNKKQFLLYQIRSISNRFGLAYDGFLNILSDSASILGTSDCSIELLRRFAELKSETGKKIIRTNEADEEALIETIKRYLIQPDESLPPTIKHSELTKSLSGTLLAYRSREALLAFLTKEKGRIALQIHQWDSSIFEIISQLLISTNPGLKNKVEQEELLEHISTALKKATNKHALRREVFLKLLTHKTITRSDLKIFQLDGIKTTQKSLSLQYYKSLISSKIVIDNAQQKSKSDTPALNISFVKKVIRSFIKDGKDSEFRTTISTLFRNERETVELITSLTPKELEVLSYFGSPATTNQLVRRVAKALALQVDNQNVTSASHEALHLLFTFIRSAVLLQVPAAKLRKKAVELEKLGISFHQSNYPGFLNTESTYFEALEKVLKTGKWEPSINSLTFHHLLKRWHIRNDDRYLRIIRNSSISAEVVSVLQQHLGFVIFPRFLQVLVGGQFNQFLSLSKDVEYLLEKATKTDTMSKDEVVWSFRLKYAYLSGISRISFERIFNFYVQEYASYHRQDIARANQQIQSGLNQEKQKIFPNSLRKKVDRILKSTSEHSARKEALPALEPDVNLPETPNSITIYDAGVIIAWPFLSRLFDRLGLLNEEKLFKSVEDQEHACRLVYYIGNGYAEAPEYQMTMAKMLTGIKLKEPIVSKQELGDDDFDMVESMLQGLIDHWDSLGSTSIAGLRSGFLQRAGTLSRDDQDWVLNVEKSGIDALLKFLPWGISSVKLPWTKYVIYTSWI